MTTGISRLRCHFQHKQHMRRISRLMIRCSLLSSGTARPSRRIARLIRLSTQPVALGSRATDQTENWSAWRTAEIDEAAEARPVEYLQKHFHPRRLPDAWGRD
jgi:hypothetical protein